MPPRKIIISAQEITRPTSKSRAIPARKARKARQYHLRAIPSRKSRSSRNLSIADYSTSAESGRQPGVVENA